MHGNHPRTTDHGAARGTPSHRPFGRSARGASRLAIVLIAVAVVGTVAALAVPKFLAPSDEAAIAPLTAASTDPAMTPVVVQAAANGHAPGAVPPVERPQPAPPTVRTSADGDLVVELHLRWPSAVSGTSVPATVRFVNTSLKGYHLPASGEPHPTLAIVVLDREGNEVRRVVESGPDPYPRRTTLVPSGGAMDVPAMVVGATDLALPPGEYTVHAELRPDAAWARLGLPMWKAPYGPARSLQMPLTISAKP